MTQIVEWLDQHHINVATAIGTVATLVLASILILILSRLLRRWLAYLRLHLQLTYETTLIISRVFTTFLWVVTGSMLLSVWGVGLGGIWAFVAGAITVIGVGFLATWAMISNITATFFLTLWRPFNFGQIVEILPENLQGQVTDRNMMFTTLREEGGSVLLIPNNLFFQKIFRVSGQAAVAAEDLLERIP
jgi:small-conductance mechanosensitive channel